MMGEQVDRGGGEKRSRLKHDFLFLFYLATYSKFLGPYLARKLRGEKRGRSINYYLIHAFV